MEIISRSTSFLLDEWFVETSLCRITRGDEVVKIDPRNMEVLLQLAARPGEVISSTEIEANVWGNVIVTASSLYQSITQLRKALGDDKNAPRYIETIPRKGYRLIPQPRAGSRTSSEPAVARTPRIRLPLKGRAVAAATSLALAVIAVAITAFAVGSGRAQKSSPTAATERAPVIDPTGNQPTARSLIELDRRAAEIALRAGRVEEARWYINKAIAAQRSDASATHPALGELMADLANVQVWAEEYEAAETTARQALSIVEQTAPPNSPRRIKPLTSLGDTLMLLECYEEAEKYLLSGLALARSLYGNTGDYVPSFLNSLTELRLRQGRLQEAETLARESIPMDTRVEGETPDIALARTVLAHVLLKAGRVDEAIAEARTALAVLGRTARPNHPYVASAQHVLGEALCRTGQFAECERAVLAEIPIWKDSNASQWRVARALSALGEAELGQGRIAEAPNISRWLQNSSLVCAERSKQTPGA